VTGLVQRNFVYIWRANFGATAPAAAAGSVLQSEPALSIGRETASAPLLFYADVESQPTSPNSATARISTTAVPFAQNAASELLLLDPRRPSSGTVRQFTHFAHEEGLADGVRLADSQNGTFEAVSAAFERIARADFLSFKPKF
jgi:hypothetical protein